MEETHFNPKSVCGAGSFSRHIPQDVSMDPGRLSTAWRTELDARVKRRESGETRSHSREEVHQEIEAILV